MITATKLHEERYVTITAMDPASKSPLSGDGGRRIRVVYWNNQPTPYVVSRLNAVVARGGLDIEAWFDEMRQPDRSWDVRPDEWLFAWRKVPRFRIAGRYIHFPFEDLCDHRPDILICNYDQPGSVLGAVVARAIAGRVALRVLPAYEAQLTPNFARSWVWKFLFRSVDGGKIPGPAGRQFANKHGLPTSRLWPVTQSIDVDLYRSARTVTDDMRVRTRSAWGSSTVYFVVVSRMIESKGIRTLLQAWQSVRAERPDLGLVMVGEGANESEFRRLSAGWPEVVWLGFCQPANLPIIYAGADALVFPTHGDPNGLVVEEALAAGLPVITTDAAGDIRSRVREGSNGYVVPAAQAKPLADAILKLAANPLGSDDQEPSVTDIYAPESYAEDFERFCVGLTRTRRRHTWQAAVAWLVSCEFLAWRQFRQHRRR